MLPIRLVTRRFVGGYELLAEGVLTTDPLQTEPWIVEAVDLERPFFIRFIDLVSDDDFLNFLDRFGDQSAVSLEALRTEAARLREDAAFALLRTKGQGRGSGQVEALASLNPLLATEHLRAQMRRVGGRYRLCFEAQALSTFMVLEIASAFEAEAELGSCQHCGRHFLFGPETKRRSHSKYCEDKCRLRALRARNAKKEP